MTSIIKNIRPVVIGGLVAVIIIFCVEFIGQRLYPLPPGIDPYDPAALRAASAKLPAGAFLCVLLGWAVGTFAGAWVAARLAPSQPLRHALLLGALVLAMGVANMLMIPHPLWFVVSSVLVVLIAALNGARAAQKRTT